MRETCPGKCRIGVLVERQRAYGRRLCEGASAYACECQGISLGMLEWRDLENALLQAKLSVTEAARKTGFSSVQYFCRAFAAVYKTSPAVWRKFIVEMQMEWRADFKQRVLLNASKAYVRQLPKGNEYSLLQPVYSLNLVNETFEPDMDEHYHYYHLVHDLRSDKVLDGLHLVFVELPKFKAKNLTEKKMQVLWLRFLTEIDPDGSDEVSQDLLDNPQTGQALEIVRESGLNDAERAAYDGFWDRVSIEATKKADMDRAVAERDAAVAERDAEKAQADAAVARADAAVARADAAVEKLHQDKLQTARNLKAMNLTNEQIAAATGLSAAEIDKLK